MNGTDPMKSYAIIPATHNSTTHGPMDGVWVISHDPKRGFTHQQTNTDMVIEFTTFFKDLSLIQLILIIFIVTVLIR